MHSLKDLISHARAPGGLACQEIDSLSSEKGVSFLPGPVTLRSRDCLAVSDARDREPETRMPGPLRRSFDRFFGSARDARVAVFDAMGTTFDSARSMPGSSSSAPTQGARGVVRAAISAPQLGERSYVSLAQLRPEFAGPRRLLK